MVTVGRIRFVLRMAFAAAAVAGMTPARAQIGMESIFGGGRMPPTKYRISLDWVTHGDAELETATDDVAFDRLGIGVSATLAKTETARLSLATRWHRLPIETDALLPLNAMPFPEQLDGLDISLGYNQRLDSGRTVMLRLGAGSSSDEIFAEEDVSTYSLLFTTMGPLDDGEAWMFFVIGGSYMAELNYLPIPGFAYLKASRTYNLVAGIPFVMGSWRGEKWSVAASYFPVTNVNLFASYRFARVFRFKAGLSRKYAGYTMYDMPDEQERLALYETRAYVGLSGFLPGRISFDLQTGLSYNRVIYQGDGFYIEGYENDGEALSLGDALFVSLQLRMMGW